MHNKEKNLHIGDFTLISVNILTLFKELPYK